MPYSLGQIVDFSKYNRGREGLGTDCHAPAMPQAKRKPFMSSAQIQSQNWVAPPPSLFGSALRTRIRQARETTGLTQEQMADKLGIRQSKYAKYETRSMMPHPLLARFSDITGASLRELLKDPR